MEGAKYFEVFFFNAVSMWGASILSSLQIFHLIKYFFCWTYYLTWRNILRREKIAKLRRCSQLHRFTTHALKQLKSCLLLSPHSLPTFSLLCLALANCALFFCIPVWTNICHLFKLLTALRLKPSTAKLFLLFQMWPKRHHIIIAFRAIFISFSFYAIHYVIKFKLKYGAIIWILYASFVCENKRVHIDHLFTGKYGHILI